MGSTDQFQRQHGELVELATQIMSMLSVSELPRRVAECRLLLARFAGKLRIHAAMENDALYPRLIAHEDEAVRAKAQWLLDDVQRVYTAFDQFSSRWTSAEQILARPDAFAKETRQLLKTLGGRMQREDDELYPLVDAVER